MPDNPREILKAAGVECAEVDEWLEVPDVTIDDVSYHASVAILTLARLVAEYKWAAESLQTELLQAALDLGFFIPTLAARLARYEADHV